ncbi:MULTISPECIES: tol-pal system-associated acyl-CoA thioesterase [unclassified Acinetobacter]|uniref:tol-pal system-associated acyl-CoA thioesterase n=1 Tax=unclassified Acinetobacter TaxID=196816 RepID=UPI0035B7EC8F
MSEFRFNIRVYIEDTDAGGIVYHANHIKYMERTRTEWLRAAGFDHYWHQSDYNFVVHQIAIKYHRPIMMDDYVTVTAKALSCKTASFVLEQKIYRGEELLVSGEVGIACLDKNLRPRKFPENLRAMLIDSIAMNSQ